MGDDVGSAPDGQAVGLEPGGVDHAETLVPPGGGNEGVEEWLVGAGTSAMSLM